jgi:hypothetical protein
MILPDVHWAIRPIGWKPFIVKGRSVEDVVASLPILDEEVQSDPYSAEYVEWCRIEGIPRERYDPYGYIHARLDKENV